MYSTRLLESVSDISLGSAFLKNVWGGAEDVIPVDVAIATGHVGGYFAASFHADEIIAASYGFLGAHRERSTLHSHATASTVAGAGFALKQHQRAWAQERGLGAITWTFDPLVRRNCYFNLTKLGAVAVEYLENFYGEMHDDLNRGDESDRFLALMSLEPCEGAKHIASTKLAIVLNNLGSSPVASLDSAEFIQRREAFALELPEDVEALRITDPALAKQWRVAVRGILSDCFAEGATVSRMIEKKALVVEWPESRNS